MAGGSHVNKRTRGVTVFQVRKGQVILPSAPQKAQRKAVPTAKWVKTTGTARRLL